ncbi:ATP-binding protein [Parapedobacter sp. ISTM3]|uniref:AlbA family DNA-binding domain-containing protein n=1 Tax=Parapedobacter sp. ISTM3 TaxID=2800130 RepID=UPI001905FCBA|nr:ATP-binding protein [Parapedobacter sp. ISTM3]MBK1439963.1 ATP-binding protein [Parapedobacter sp. ISTM3]
MPKVSFSNVIFNKELAALEYGDIVDFFVDAKEESTRLEFKGFSAQHGNFNNNLDGVIRGICAFLNSEGGLLIWGAPEGIPRGNNNKLFQGALSPLITLKEKDWLINKISDSITPLPIGIDVGVLRDNGNVVYVFEVQQSPYSPHQYKNTYYARLDGQTKPAPHYLIEALFKKIKYPNIEGFIKPEFIIKNGSSYLLDISVFLFNFSQLQNEENISFRLLSTNGRFVNSDDPAFSYRYNMSGHQLVFNDFSRVLHFGAPQRHAERIAFNLAELEAIGYEVALLLSFGGKLSPAKTSRYTLNLGNVDWEHPNEPNYLLTFIEENKLFIDRQTELGATRESVLQQTLKR